MTGSHLWIDTALRRTGIPRPLIKAFASDGSEVCLLLANGDRVAFRADSILRELDRGSEYRSNWPNQLRATRRISRMLADVPLEPGPSGQIVRARRVVPLALALAAAATTALVAGLTYHA